MSVVSESISPTRSQYSVIVRIHAAPPKRVNIAVKNGVLFATSPGGINLVAHNGVAHLLSPWC